MNTGHFIRYTFISYHLYYVGPTFAFRTALILVAQIQKGLPKCTELPPCDWLIKYMHYIFAYIIYICIKKQLKRCT